MDLTGFYEMKKGFATAQSFLNEAMLTRLEELVQGMAKQVDAHSMASRAAHDAAKKDQETIASLREELAQAYARIEELEDRPLAPELPEEEIPMMPPPDGLVEDPYWGPVRHLKFEPTDQDALANAKMADCNPWRTYTP